MGKLSDLSPEKRLELGQKLREMPEEDKLAFINGLSVDEQKEMLFDPIINLRPKQWIPPDRKKNVSLLLTGRG